MVSHLVLICGLAVWDVLSWKESEIVIENVNVQKLCVINNLATEEEEAMSQVNDIIGLNTAVWISQRRS